MSTTPFILGINCQLYIGEPGAALASLTVLDNVKDVTLNLESGEADTSTRANQGWASTAQTLRRASITFQLQAKPGDSNMAMVRDAYLGGTLVRLAALTGEYDAEDVEGLVGDFSITSFSRSEPLEDAVVYDVTANLAVFDQWHGTAGGVGTSVPAAADPKIRRDGGGGA